MLRPAAGPPVYCLKRHNEDAPHTCVGRARPLSLLPQRRSRRHRRPRPPPPPPSPPRSAAAVLGPLPTAPPRSAEPKIFASPPPAMAGPARRPRLRRGPDHPSKPPSRQPLLHWRRRPPPHPLSPKFQGLLRRLHRGQLHRVYGAGKKSRCV
jgi:hypothetical protein